MLLNISNPQADGIAMHSHRKDLSLQARSRCQAVQAMLGGVVNYTCTHAGHQVLKDALSTSQQKRLEASLLYRS